LLSAGVRGELISCSLEIAGDNARSRFSTTRSVFSEADCSSPRGLTFLRARCPEIVGDDVRSRFLEPRSAVVAIDFLRPRELTFVRVRPEIVGDDVRSRFLEPRSAVVAIDFLPPRELTFVRVRPEIVGDDVRSRFLEPRFLFAAIDFSRRCRRREDALRFFLVRLAPPGRNVRFSARRLRRADSRPETFELFMATSPSQTSDDRFRAPRVRSGQECPRSAIPIPRKMRPESPAGVRQRNSLVNPRTTPTGSSARLVPSDAVYCAPRSKGKSLTHKHLFSDSQA